MENASKASINLRNLPHFISPLTSLRKSLLLVQSLFLQMINNQRRIFVKPFVQILWIRGFGLYGPNSLSVASS